MKNNEFYSSLSENYDEMINFDKSVENKSKLLGNIFSPENMSCADIGSGTGVDSIALSKLGVKTDGFEPSIKMIGKAEINVRKFSQSVKFFNYSLDEIPPEFDEKYDGVICLGNVLANIPNEKLNTSLKKISNLLKKDGMFLVQILNYTKILNEKERIVNITQNGGKTFIRFYDFYKDRLQFNILIYETQNPNNRKLISTPIFPHEKATVAKVLELQSKIEFFGSLKMDPFDENNSSDLVILGKKNN
ncbi:MAG: class I SAM-dependent methyltransferase [Melioribacteraceae bacterium]|nr:class I SAM-dependent methyltransferase [Melioribacteraceae bacterium]MCF8432070.1 class I SAM-dependent methyltransferase [Melioribacteraceae bacterium]